MTEVDKFRNAFIAVRDNGEYVSNRSGNTGIGKTLEDAIGVIENNIDAPDLHGFEIKSQRALSESYVTLFTKAPTFPRAVNNKLRQTYGSNDSHFADIKVLHTSIFENRWNTHIAGLSYKLQRNDEERRLYLLVKRMDNNVIVEQDIYWTYDILNNICLTKLDNLAFIQADVKKIDAQEHFTFHSCKLYYGLTLDSLLMHITNGSIMFDIRIGAYKNPLNTKTYGKSHDHGSGFRIKKEMLSSLYKNEQII
jgi:hypothetical protein